MKVRVIAVPLAAALLLAGCAVPERTFEWRPILADGSRTGVTAPTADNAAEALGSVEETLLGDKYSAPNGKTYRGDRTTEIARLMIEAQPAMHDLKQVIAVCPEGMGSRSPESALSNWAVDVLMEKVAAKTGKRVDVGVINFGGIRCSMPKGDVMKDDIVSMFPFKNYGVLVTVDGNRLTEILTYMAEHRVEALGGVQLVIQDHQLVSALVGGQPIEADRLYNIATIDFLLQGGDGHQIGKDAVSIERTGVLMMDMILEKVFELSAQGAPIEGAKDGRVVIRRAER